MLKTIHNFFRKLYHTRYHGIYRHAKKLFVFDLALLGLAVVMLGASVFFFFWKPTLIDLVDLSFNFGGERVISGEEIKITIDYQNRSKHDLNNATLAVHLPKGFVIDRAKTPVEIFSANSTFNLGKIEAGGKNQVALYGQIFAEPNQEEKITGYLSYERADNNAKEQKISAAFFKTGGSVLTAEIIMDSTAFPGRELPLTLKIKNNGNSLVEHIYIKPATTIIFPDEKTLQDFALKPGEAKVISGAVNVPAQTGALTQKISVGLVINDVQITQATAAKELSVYFPELVSDIKLTGDTAYADSGQILPATISWKNNSPFTLNNLRLIISPTPGVVDLRATARDNNLTVVGTELVADKKTRTALASGLPGTADQFEIKLKLLPRFNAGNQTNLEIKTKMEAEMNDVPGQKFTRDGSAVIRLPLVTQIFMSVLPMYYTAEGDQLGRGALPPTVGETTKYWMAANISNTTNPISGNAFRAVLADGVEFTGKQSVTIGPVLKYDAGSRTVSWNYNLAPAQSEIGLYFEVSIKPTASQVGKKVLLIKNAAYNATDDLLGKQLEARVGAVDNTLGANDRGRLVGAEVTE
ncbi:MAG: hypothetical protein PHD72_02400 [Patescibacteria group bacterium]|nr:hypothetical protein [Patescibacteria group bacterium]